MAGWQPRYVNDVTAPAEIPPQLSALKRQQARWAKGSIQTLRKLGGDVWRSDRPLTTRLFALFHLSSYLLHPLLLLPLIAGPLMLLGVGSGPLLALLSITTVGAAALCRGPVASAPAAPGGTSPICPSSCCWARGCASTTVGPSGRAARRRRTIPAHAQVSGRARRRSLAAECVPAGPGAHLLAEFSMLVYALTVAGMAMAQGKGLSAPFLLLYAGGFAIMVTVDLWQARPISTRHKPVRGRRPLRDRWSA
ncbi:MAG: hypothetical protein R2838_15660 [Caldilineaceae bacterium]